MWPLNFSNEPLARLERRRLLSLIPALLIGLAWYSLLQEIALPYASPSSRLEYHQPGDRQHGQQDMNPKARSNRLQKACD
ncbi:MAG: hypothetical protein JJU31_11245 [Wenzhouxiangella sp.]|nr:hypothetical protein [Wenzhouxiangella sp.]TVR97398.1 MAG: hypothetical protein EA418_03185 [Wenzhouxiangellaceae bacterium]